MITTNMIDINVLLDIVNNSDTINDLIKLNVDKFGAIIKFSKDDINDIISKLQTKKDIISLSYDDGDLIASIRAYHSYGLKIIISRRNNTIMFTFSSKFIRDYGENHYIIIVQQFFDEIGFEVDKYQLNQRLEVGYIEIALDLFGLEIRNKIKDLRTKVISNYIKERSPEKKRTIKINRKYDGGYNHIESNENDKDTFIKAYLDSSKTTHVKIYDKLTNALFERIGENEHWIRYYSSILFGLNDENTIQFSEGYKNLSKDDRTIVFNKICEKQSIIRVEYNLNNQMISKFIGYDIGPLSPDFLLIRNAITNKHLLLEYLIKNIWNVTYKHRNGNYRYLKLFDKALSYIDNYEPDDDNSTKLDEQIKTRNNIMKSIDYAVRTRGGIKSIIDSAKAYARDNGDITDLITILSDMGDIITSGLNDLKANATNIDGNMSNNYSILGND